MGLRTKRLSEEDERELVGTQAREEPTDIGYGIAACSKFIRFDLAGGISVEAKPVRHTWGTDIRRGASDVMEGMFLGDREG